MASVSLIETSCWCGLPFAVPERLYNQCYRHGETLHCPLGHKMVWQETEVDKMRRERDRERQRVAEWQETANEQLRQRKAAERSNVALKGTITKMKRRTAAGACPCCRRNFQNLQRHMKTKHPEYGKPDLQVVA